MLVEIRWREYGLVLYRLMLAYIFYFIARLLFYVFNKDVVDLDSWVEFFRLAYYGLAFDTTAILYVNILFILLSIIPIFVNRHSVYQKILFWIYFITNTIAYIINFIDIPYYRFSKARLTVSVLDLIKNEHNKTALISIFFADYWHIGLIFLVLIVLWIILYKRLSIKYITIKRPLSYVLFSTVGLIFFVIISLGGIRGGIQTVSPINIIDASRHTKQPTHTDVVLNSTFTLIRTLGKTYDFKLVNYVSKSYIYKNIKPVKQYNRQVESKPNIIIFILESFAREFWGCMNQENNIENYYSHTPFLDSLSKDSYVFYNAFANGRQSIHAMPSIFAGIPSFKTTFSTSQYADQHIQSIVSICKSQGYNTSFFHGAENGSMGFWGFSNILGFDHYYGKSEYNNNADYDGAWGIWDEPFLQYMGRNLSSKKEPFLSAVFTVTSHHPYNIPDKYKDVFKQGKIPIHRSIEYSDYSIKKFFENAKNTDWFQNTIFVFTADHAINDIYYDEYTKAMNLFAVPIMFYSPNKKLVKQGRSGSIAQHSDIYPSLVDLMGYNKPFRSWGHSLFTKYEDEPYRAINSTGAGIYQLMQGNYIYIYDGNNITGIYDIKDLGLKNNLMNTELPDEVIKGQKDIKAFVQDYMDRVINKKLTGVK